MNIRPLKFKIKSKRIFFYYILVIPPVDFTCLSSSDLVNVSFFFNFFFGGESRSDLVSVSFFFNDKGGAESGKSESPNLGGCSPC
jgi:hypothetical protein